MSDKKNDKTMTKKSKTENPKLKDYRKTLTTTKLKNSHTIENYDNSREMENQGLEHLEG